MIYQYECNECGYNYEDIKSHKERFHSECPRCKTKNVSKLITSNTAIMNTYLKDLKGTPIWFPRDGKPYFDKALRRTFTSAKEKKSYMDSKCLVMDGSQSPSKWPIESGDMRSREYRRNNRWED